MTGAFGIQPSLVQDSADPGATPRGTRGSTIASQAVIWMELAAQRSPPHTPGLPPRRTPPGVCGNLSVVSATRSAGLRVWVAVAAATLTLGPLVSPAAVLCRGEDGHVALETAFARCCQASDRDPAPTSASAAEVIPEHPCGDCTDLEVGEAAAPVPRGHAAPPPVAADRLTEPPTASPAARCSTLPAAGAPSRDRDLAVARATVLLR